jgi:crossover junction endodeoxyribonuclease RuvC
MTTYNLRVLGVDPGTATTGWAVVTEKNGKIIPLSYGHISTKKNLPTEERILEISRDLEKIIKKYRPQEAAVEEIFFFKNQKTVIDVAQSRGAIALTLSLNNVKVAGYTPLEIKQALTGYGRAEKKQVQLMLKNILNLKSIPQPDDTADAIAVALCHINSRKMNGLK